jgi:hypothetical protein
VYSCGIKQYLLIKHGFVDLESQVQVVLRIMYRASENSCLEKIASFVVQNCREWPTAGCHQVVVVDALFFFIWVGQDGPNRFITQCILCCRNEKTVTQVVICQLSWKIGPVRHDSDDGESLSQRLRFTHQCLDVVWVPVSEVEQNVQGIDLSDLSAGGCSGLAGGRERVQLVKVDVIGTVDDSTCLWTSALASPGKLHFFSEMFLRK